MEDKELFDFFRNRSNSFEEMPSDALWNKIQTNIKTSKSTTFFTASKITIFSVLIVAMTLIGFFVYTDSEASIEDKTIHPKENRIIKQPSSNESEIISEIDTLKNRAEADTLKPKKVLVKKLIATVKKDTFSVFKKLLPGFKIDSLKIIDSKFDIDSLKIKPLVKGNRLLFETKQLLTTIEFDSFVQKILTETETNYGALIVIKAKGNKPFRHIVKFPEKNSIPKSTIQPAHYTTKLIVKDSMIISDSIYFNTKK